MNNRQGWQGNDEDPLSIGRGILWGLVLGTLMWIGIIMGVTYWLM